MHLKEILQHRHGLGLTRAGSTRDRGQVPQESPSSGVGIRKDGQGAAEEA